MNGGGLLNIREKRGALSPPRRPGALEVCSVCLVTHEACPWPAPAGIGVRAGASKQRACRSEALDSPAAFPARLAGPAEL